MTETVELLRFGGMGHFIPGGEGETERITGP